ncbi:MAG: ABC transporter permease [Marinoscillum sp.]
MLRNLFTVATRNIKRQKFFAVIHLIGLSIGLMCCIVIGLYTYHELKNDTFHTQGDRIYRINQTFIWGDDDALFGSTGPAVADAIADEVPEFEAMTRVHPTGSKLISTTKNGQSVVFEEADILAVDPNFLGIFSFPLIAGDSSTALNKPQSVIITESTAKKYFNEEDALGQYLEIGDPDTKKSYVITGVSQDPPTNSHIQFDFLISMNSLPHVADRRDSWMWTTFVTFGLMREDASPGKVASKVADVPGKYLEAFLQKYRGISYQEFIDSGEEWDLYIQPLLDIHLRSENVYSRLNQVGSMRNLYILWIVGGLILGLSLINFINLSTAKATSRAKEVGIRKVIGSSRKLLIYQFLTESFVYVLASVMIAFFLVEMILPMFNGLIDTQLTTNTLVNPSAIFLLVLTTVFIGLLSGIYPAFYLSSFRPAKVLKGKIAQGLKGGRVRNILVTAQFTISISMIASTLIVRDQVNYWMNYDLGFERHNKIIIENMNRMKGSEEGLKNAILSHPQVAQVSITSDTPPMIFDFDNFSRSVGENYNISVNYLTVDEHFIDVIGLDIKHGRGFKKDFNDSTNIVVNEYFAKAFGFTSPASALNQTIRYNDVEFSIIGVVNDFNTTLSSETYPVALLDHKAPIFRNPQPKMIVDLNRELSGDETVALLKSFEAKWLGLNDQSPFSYSFLDQEYKEIFTKTINFGKLLSALAFLAVLIACLGLIGLVAFVIEKRTKEIGVRKVLGATVLNIWIMLSSDFGKLLLLGFLIAAPLTWYAMGQWIQNYELRTNISLLTIIWAGVLMVLIAILTTCYQTLKASQINPVEYLNEE